MIRTPEHSVNIITTNLQIVYQDLDSLNCYDSVTDITFRFSFSLTSAHGTLSVGFYGFSVLVNC